MFSFFVSLKMLLEILLPENPLQVINFYVFIRFWCRKAKKTKYPFYFLLNANMLTVSAGNKYNLKGFNVAICSNLQVLITFLLAICERIMT